MLEIESKQSVISHSAIEAAPVRAAKASFSQSGEDRIIHFLFQAFRSQAKLNYVDIGAAFPIGDNNTFLFYDPHNGGLLVEADPEYMPQYAGLRPADKAVNFAVVPKRLMGSGKIEFYAMNDRGWSTVSPEHLAVAEKLNKGGIRNKFIVECMTINDLLSRYFAGREIDLLSIDIEGVDGEVLAELDTDQFRPRAIIAENSGGLRVHEGAMHAKGYATYAYTHVNTVYIDRREFAL